ncbi:uncharacterized protein LOC120334198 [Styela clava]
MNCLVSVLVLAALAAYGNAECVDKAIQPGIDFTRLGGVWHQYRYTPDTHYEDMNCYTIEITDINKQTKTFVMKSLFRVAKKSIKKNLSHKAFSDFIEFDVNANFGERVEGKPFIGDHVATDYTNYILFYNCEKSGKATVDIEIRQGLTSLSAAVIEEVQTVLNDFGVDYFDLTVVNQSTCPYPSGE